MEDQDLAGEELRLRWNVVVSMLEELAAKAEDPGKDRDLFFLPEAYDPDCTPYCGDCAEAELARLRAEKKHPEDSGRWRIELAYHVTGGGDGQRWCETCGVPLTHSLTQYGLEKEVADWEEFEGPITPSQAREALSLMWNLDPIEEYESLRYALVGAMEKLLAVEAA